MKRKAVHLEIAKQTVVHSQKSGVVVSKSVPILKGPRPPTNPPHRVCESGRGYAEGAVKGNRTPHKRAL